MDITNYLDEHENKSLLRVLTCGSVDDGKSTLIGRLLYDSKLIFTDQLQALQQVSLKNGTTGAGNIDYALLLDGLKAEREQGITIDVAYRYFTTPKRKFIIADCPGHEQYTRNMATGASTANVAVILIDARHGVLTQTKRHAYIVSLLGIKHLIVAINKMDLFEYDQSVYHRIQQEFAHFAQGLNLPDIRYIPISALEGENVVHPSSQIAWYDGDSLLEILEGIDISNDLNYENFRFPVQYVSRPDLNFRGFSGSILSGTIQEGDEVTVLPSRKKSVVKRIVTADGDLKLAYAPLPVTIELHDEIDISSGDLIVRSNDVPAISRQVEATLVWMTEHELRPQYQYLIRHAGRNVLAKVEEILYVTDVNTLEQTEASNLSLNQVGRVRLSLNRPIFADTYESNQATGAFILIDPLSNTTAGAGRVEVVNLQSHEEEISAFRKLKLETRKRHHDKQLLFGQSIFVSGQDIPAVKDWAQKLDAYLYRKNLNSHYLGVEDNQSNDLEKQTLIQIAQLFGITGTLAITALDELPHIDTIQQLALVQGDFRTFKIWIGDKDDAPIGVDLIVPPTNKEESVFLNLYEKFSEEKNRLVV